MNQSANISSPSRPLIRGSAGGSAAAQRSQMDEAQVARVSVIAFLALLAYLVLALMRVQEYTWIDFNAPIIPVIEVTMMVAWFVSTKPPGFARTLPVILLGCVYFISSLSVDASYSVGVTTNYFLNIGFVYIVVAQIAVDPRRADLVMAIFGTCMAVISVQCILMAHHPDHMGWTGLQAIERTDSIPRVWQVRYIGTLEDPNDLGMTLLAALPMLAFLASSSRSRLLQSYFVISMGACIYAIYLLNSRGTVLGLVAMVGLVGMFRLGITKAILLGIACLPVAIVLAPSRLSEGGIDDSIIQRIASWYNGMKMFTSNPLFGVGKDQYLAHHHKVSHNSWIEQVAEFGMIGYLLWNRIVLGSLVEVFQLVRADQTLASSAAQAQESQQQQTGRIGRKKTSTVGLPGFAALPAPTSTLPAAVAVADGTATASAQKTRAATTELPELDDNLRLEGKRTRALLYSIAGILAAIFFIDRSDSLITFLVCALIAGTLTRYKLTRSDVQWLPVSLFVYLGAFIALVVVYVAIQVWVL